MMATSNGCGLCPWSCSGKVGAYVYSGIINIYYLVALLFRIFWWHYNTIEDYSGIKAQHFDV